MDTVIYTFVPLVDQVASVLENTPDIDPATQRCNVGLVGMDDTVAFARRIFLWYPGVSCRVGNALTCYSIEQLQWSLAGQRKPCRLVFSLSQ